MEDINKKDNYKNIKIFLIILSCLFFSIAIYLSFKSKHVLASPTIFLALGQIIAVIVNYYI